MQVLATMRRPEKTGTETPLGVLTPTKPPLPYLRKVAYLEFTGTQYIDTGVYGSNDISASIDFQLTSVAVNSGVFGAYYLNRNVYLYENSAKNWQIGFGGYANYVAADTTRHLVKWDNGKVYYDGAVAYTSSVSSFTTQYTMLVGNMRQSNGGLYTGAKMKLFSLNIGNANPIPVLDLSGRPALYDEVSGRFFYNQGTGEFAWGEIGGAV